MVANVLRSERRIVLAAGFVVMSVAGTVFSWSLFTHPLMALFGWTSLQVALAFSLVVVFFGIGSVAGGFAHDRFGPRSSAFIGAALWGLGSILAGAGIAHFGLWWLYLTYGAVGGFGCGMVYVVPGATVTKWFPEERGLANGVIIAGFGFGSLIFNGIVASNGAFRHVANLANAIVESHTTTHAGQAVIMPLAAQHGAENVIAGVFLWSGVVFLAIGCAAALLLRPPPAGFRITTAATTATGERDFAPRQMMRTRAFYMLGTVMFVNETCGLAFFSNAVPTYVRVTGLAAATATLVFGGLSAANGVGRFLWAWLSDVIGRRASLSICLALQGLALASVAYVHDAAVATLAFVVAMMSFGGVYGIAPAVIADFFGTRFLGEDYSFVITPVAIAGLVGPLSAAWLEGATGSITAWLPIAAVMLVASAVCPILARRPALPASGGKPGPEC